jgi:hypothetical protein
MAVQWTTTRQAAQINGVKVLIHGKAGVGKTPLAATAPNPIIIASEPGLVSLNQHEIPTAIVKSVEDFDDAYKYIAHSPDARARFQTVFMDSGTELAEVCLTAEKKKSKDPRKAYGEMQDKIMDRFRWFRDLDGYNVCIICKGDRVKDDMTGGFIYGPMMPGQQLGKQLPFLFDIILSMEVWKDPATNIVHSYLRSQRDHQYEARDRSGTLAPFEPPNLTDIFNKVMRGERHVARQ